MNPEIPPAVRLIVAEDDPVTADILRYKLTAKGWQVTMARNGEEAWDHLLGSAASDQAVDLLITDHQMPRVSGLQLIRRLRGEGRFAGLPVILCSAKGLELEAEDQLESLRISRIIYKPFSPRQMIQAISDLLGASSSGTAAGFCNLGDGK